MIKQKIFSVIKIVRRVVELLQNEISAAATTQLKVIIICKYTHFPTLLSCNTLKPQAVFLSLLFELYLLFLFDSMAKHFFDFLN